MSTFFDFCLCSTVPRSTFALLFNSYRKIIRHHFLSPPLFDTHKMEVIYADCRASRIACDGQKKTVLRWHQQPNQLDDGKLSSISFWLQLRRLIYIHTLVQYMFIVACNYWRSVKELNSVWKLSVPHQRCHLSADWNQEEEEVWNRTYRSPYSMRPPFFLCVVFL
jgi:hypothetical protein